MFYRFHIKLSRHDDYDVLTEQDTIGDGNSFRFTNTYYCNSIFF